MTSYRLLLACCLLPSIFAACGTQPAEPTPGPRVRLPVGTPFAIATLAIGTATAAGSVGAGATFEVPLPANRAQLVVVTAQALGSAEARPVLLAVVRPGVHADINATTTAQALVLLAPFVARSDLAELAVLDPLVAGLPETAALAAAIADGLKSGHTLEEQAADPTWQATWGHAVTAAIAAAAEAPFDLANKSRRGVTAFPLTVTPSEMQSLLEVAADGDDAVTVRNWAGRWASAWVGKPGSDVPLGLIQAGPKFLSLANVGQMMQRQTFITSSATLLSLASWGVADLHFYGPGLLPTAAGCAAPGYDDVRLLVPTIGTTFDNILTPTLDLVFGLNMASVGVYQDFLIAVTLDMLTDAELLDAMASSPPNWGKLAASAARVAVWTLFEKAVSVSFKTVALQKTAATKGQAAPKVGAALLAVMAGQGADIQIVTVGDVWWLRILSGVGISAVQAYVKVAILPLKIASMAGAAIDLGKGMASVALTRPAECFQVTIDATCGDGDGDGFVTAATPLLGCAVQPGDCDDANLSLHPGAAEVCDGKDDDCNGQTDDVTAVLLASDAANCGQCGKTCGEQKVCIAGACGIKPFADATDQQTTEVSVTITQTDTSDAGGKVKVFASVQTQSGDPVEQLTIGNFGVVETLSGVSASVPIESLEVAEDSTNGLRAVLVIDSSGSMYTTPSPSALDLAKSAAKDFVSYMKFGDQAAIIDFSSKVIVRQTLTGDKLALFNAIDACGIQGGTAMFDAVLAALKLLGSVDGSVDGQRAVLVLTDGDDNGSQCSGSACIAYVVGPAKLASVPVYTIGLAIDSGSAAEQALLALSTGTSAGGKGIGYHHAPNPVQLKGLYEKIATILKKTYVVGWFSTGKSGQTVKAKITATYQAAIGVLADSFGIEFVVGG